ncbi:MAG: threonylcarbamoyl-AMP synthase [Dehalococcoidia bacterium]|nr:threonylcarbamoyl-AMP synthase [Dehalococcoidia bacterium]
MNALQRQIENGVRILKQGGIVVFPTDTVYALGADAFKPKAVKRIYEVKKRPRQLAFPLLIADMSQLTAVAESISGIAWFLASHFWPGGLTLVLPKADSLPAYLARESNIAVRVPDHPVCLALIQCLGNPIIGTSANISGKPATLTADEARRQLGDGVDLIIDGGKSPGGGESTIVDVTHEVPVTLRQGVITQYKIEEACKEYYEVSNDAYCSRL